MSNQPGVKFLLVDDDQGSRSTVREYLYTFGYEDVTEAENVGEAIRILNSKPIDFVISDWDMPRASGYSLLKLIKRQERFKDVAFLIISGPKEHEENKVKRAAALGVDGYLLKPFRAAKFKSILNAILARRA